MENKKIDKRNYSKLRNNGWKIITLWECQLKPKKIIGALSKLESKLGDAIK